MKLGPRFKQIFRCSFLLTIAIASLIYLTQQPAYAHDSAGYSHDSGSKTSNPRWMSQLAPGKKLSSVSIIGTHDTMARFGGVLVHKFICRGTVEEKIDALIEEKAALGKNLLEGGTETLLTEMDDAALLDLVALDLNRMTLQEQESK